MIAIIDYQMGNLRSVQKAFERVGYEAIITDNPNQLAQADGVVLPGVGAFRDAIGQLNDRDLVSPIKDLIHSGKPFLGICLGLQLLFEVSYEDGHYEGMGILPGKVVKFDLPREFKVPHMGWNELQFTNRPPIFEGIADQAHYYFVHSYYVVPEDSSVIAIEAEYGTRFCAAIWRDNLVATQFHPEKSQADGLQVLKQFGAWASEELPAR